MVYEWLTANAGTEVANTFDSVSDFMTSYNVWAWVKEGVTIVWMAVIALASMRWVKSKVFRNKQAVADFILSELRGTGVKWDANAKTVSTNKVIVRYIPSTDGYEAIGTNGYDVCGDDVSALISPLKRGKIFTAVNKAIKRCQEEAKEIASDLVLKKTRQTTHYKA